MIQISQPKTISFEVTGSSLEMSSIRNFLKSKINKNNEILCFMRDGEKWDSEGHRNYIDISCSYEDYDIVVKEIKSFIQSE